MAVPKFNEFFPAFINCLGDGKVHSLQEIREYCIKASNLTEDDIQQRLKSGQSLVNDRVGWARTYLKKAGLIDSPARTMFCLTDEGKKAYATGVDKITLDYLQQYDSFQQFYHAGRKSADQISQINLASEEEKSPQELIEYAMDQLNSSLADTLMGEVMKMDPFAFEQLVVKLLVRMGYGSSNLSLSKATRRSSDEGIDGIVTADRFGFDVIYTQAKQWNTDSVIGRPEIQKFLGALAGQGATKGIFLTTARFSNEARAFVENQLGTKIVLVDGKALMDLMIEFNLGVSVTDTYEVKRVDYDFFSEE